jgi:hypothetical protein
MSNNLNKSNYRNLRSIRQGDDTGRSHPGTANSEKRKGRINIMRFFNQARAVEIPGSLSCDNHNPFINQNTSGVHALSLRAEKKKRSLSRTDPPRFRQKRDARDAQ